MKKAQTRPKQRIEIEQDFSSCESEQDDSKQEEDRNIPLGANYNDAWRNRRRMAYFSLFSIMLVTYWALFVVPESRLKILGEVITWFYFVMASVIGGYVGFSAFEKKWNSKNK